jgi:hypothetical protein
MQRIGLAVEEERLIDDLLGDLAHPSRGSPT